VGSGKWEMARREREKGEKGEKRRYYYYYYHYYYQTSLVHWWFWAVAVRRLPRKVRWMEQERRPTPPSRYPSLVTTMFGIWRCSC